MLMTSPIGSGEPSRRRAERDAGRAEQHSPVSTIAEGDARDVGQGLLGLVCCVGDGADFR